jgi:hypothetical protein
VVFPLHPFPLFQPLQALWWLWLPSSYPLSRCRLPWTLILTWFQFHLVKHAGRRKRERRNTLGVATGARPKPLCPSHLPRPQGGKEEMESSCQSCLQIFSNHLQFASLHPHVEGSWEALQWALGEQLIPPYLSPNRESLLPLFSFP